MSGFKVEGRGLESWRTWDYDTNEIRILSERWQQLEETRHRARDEQIGLEKRAEELRTARVEELWPLVESALPVAAKRVAELLREHGLLHEEKVVVGPLTVIMEQLGQTRPSHWSGWQAPTVFLGAWGDKGVARELTAEQVRDALKAEGIVADTWLSDAGVSCRVYALEPAVEGAVTG